MVTNRPDWGKTGPSFMTPRLMKLQKDMEEAQATNQFLRILLENTLRTYQIVDRSGAGVDRNVYNETHTGLQQRISTLEREITYWKQEFDTRQATYMVEEEKAAGQQSFTNRATAEKIARGEGRLAGKGLSAIGSKLQALETEGSDVSHMSRRQIIDEIEYLERSRTPGSASRIRDLETELRIRRH